MADLVVKTVDDEQKFVYEHTTAGAGLHKVNFETENSFLDKDINIQITTPAAGTESATLTDNTDALTMGTASEGYYYPTNTISGTVAPATAGWQTTTPAAVSDEVQVGKVAQSTLKVDGVAAASGDTVIPDTTQTQTIQISAGYEGARTIVVGAMDDGQAATVNSANATVSTVTFTPGATNVAISGTATIAAPTVSQDGYISETVGTKNAGEATVAATVDLVTVGVTPSATTKTVKPVLSRTAKSGTDTFVDAASGSGTTTKPSAGAYVAVDAAAISDSVSVEGNVSAAGYGDATHFDKDAATTITVGSVAADTLYVPVAAGTATANGATVSTVNVAYNSAAGNFDVDGAANIPAPTVNTPGYVGDGIGTLNGAAGAAVVDASIAKIAIGATISGGTAVTPVISKNVATNVDSAAATTTQPASGFYVAVGSAADSSSVSAAAAVTSAGYGTTTTGEYTTVGDSATVAVNASAVTYVPITGATFANSATSGQSYTDISSTAPILISGDYLYINKGYSNNVKISLAQLVPDDATITASTGAQYLLQGQSGYTSAGELVVGTIPTYAGAYTEE